MRSHVFTVMGGVEQRASHRPPLPSPLSPTLHEWTHFHPQIRRQLCEWTAHWGAPTARLMLGAFASTGASSGIGRATCVALAAKGWNLTLTARRLQELRETEELVRGVGESGKTMLIDGDINDEAFVER